MNPLALQPFRALLAAAALLLLVAQLPLPAGPAGAIETAIALVGLAGVALGIRRHRPEGLLWPLVGASAALNVVATAAWHGPAFLGQGHTLGTSWVTDGVWIASELALAAALVHALVGRERPLPVLLDVATIAAAIGLVVGLLIVGPGLTAAHGTVTLNATLYTFTDVVLISTVLRLLMTPSGRSPALWLLAAGATAFVTSDVAWNWLTIAGGHQPAGWTEAGWTLLPLLAGLAAMHPSMRLLRRDDRLHHDELGLATPVTVGAALVVVPLLAGLDAVVAGMPRVDTTAPGGAAVLVTGVIINGLVVTRFASLLRHARRLSARAESALVERSRKLELSEERRRWLIEQLPAVILVYELGPDGLPVRPIYVGGRIEAIMGVPADEWTQHRESLLEYVHRDDRPAFVATLEDAAAGDGVRPVEFRFVRPDGREIWLRGAGSVVREADGPRLLQGMLFDITEVKRAEGEREALERELRLGQRLEAVGQLAAGIAHEINTPIQYVGDTVGFLDQAFTDVMSVADVHGELRRAAEAGSIDEELLARVREAEEQADLAYLSGRVPGAFARADEGIRQIGTIVRAMREFAHPSVADRVPVDLNDTVRNALVVTRSAYKLVADVDTDLGDLPRVVCLGGDISQVLLNLIVNAAHAIEETVGDSGRRGTIRIRTRREGDHVAISLADTGAGIPAEVAARVFDPFFTTKEVGRGTGQGLALARTMVVERHGGSLTFETEPGRGTTFHVRLPIAPVPAEAAA
ncbi:MAG: two-component system, NtrC family, sensor kinase [Solirubrobacteraceae bacterium]|nr:two-component system, NtrC family, sensor kinase [Solirubrobacteraceae bacterium]